jgi:hypothetical protein
MWHFGHSKDSVYSSSLVSSFHRVELSMSAPFVHDIILAMTEQPQEEEQTEKPGGQLLGCFFAGLLAIIIFLTLFVFMRSC